MLDIGRKLIQYINDNDPYFYDNKVISMDFIMHFIDNSKEILNIESNLDTNTNTTKKFVKDCLIYVTGNELKILKLNVNGNTFEMDFYEDYRMQKLKYKLVLDEKPIFCYYDDNMRTFLSYTRGKEVIHTFSYKLDDIFLINDTHYKHLYKTYHEKYVNEYYKKYIPFNGIPLSNTCIELLNYSYTFINNTLNYASIIYETELQEFFYRAYKVIDKPSISWTDKDLFYFMLQEK